VSVGWGRPQDEGSGPDWFAAGEDEPAAAPVWADSADSGPEPASAPGGWAALVESADAKAPAADRKPAAGKTAAQKPAAKKAAPQKAAAQKTAAKKTSSGWSSRRKDRDRADDSGDSGADRPKPAPSREKLEQRAKNIVLYHLGRQMQTRSQLADRLRKKEIPADIAEAVLDRFQELHLLDDATYAETFVRSRHAERGLAKRALGYELRRRGIDADTATEALATLDEDQEEATARRLVDSRLRATRGLDPQVRTRRLVGMLARKGYSSSVAFRAVKEALAAEGQYAEGEDTYLDVPDDD
jgi:regulatory protein